ncbi:hypothetical protein [Nocardioides sp. Iso805N]|uniref:hypothetical protein n=1 Tax=Nocardioides sp. Iso805N TaxID=1283287 RepID=UPI000363A22D|nr:hypothetical protein [Nocardioides sp. Iso805N]
MTAAAGTLSAPAPEVTAELAEAALAAYRKPAVPRYTDVDALTGFAREPVDAGLQRWAQQIATPEGFPLIGTGLHAPTYPALLWNGARLDAAAPDVSWAPLLAALAAAPDNDQGLGRLFRALQAAETVRQDAARLLVGATMPIAWPTLSTLASATAAQLMGPHEGEGLVRVLDLAASLTVLTTGDRRSVASGLWTGHGAASGWLAARLPEGAVSPMAGSVVHTLSAAAGRPLAASDGVEPGLRSVADLLARLR